MAGYVVTRIRNRAPAPPPVVQKIEAKVPLQISPDGARVVLAGQDLGTVRELKLPEGSHEIDIVLDGYQPQHLTVAVDAKGATIPPVALQPLTAFLKVGMSAGKAELNGQPVSNKSGIFNQDLPPDNYTLKLVQDKAIATIDFKIAAGAMPEVTEVKASNMTVNAVAVLGKRTRVYGAGAANFIEIPDLAPGPQVITIGEGGTTQLQVEIGAAPSLQVIVTDPEKVNLLITSNEDGASVLIDGAAAGVIRNGKFLTSRKPGPYTVAVEKPGFTSPPVEKVRLEAGKSQQAKNFALVRNAAILAIADAPDSHVFIDGVEKGVVPASGVLEVAVDPGRRKFLLKKDGFESVESEHEFRAGEKFARSGADLLRQLGKIALSVTPRNARVVANRRGGGPPVTLQEGANTLQPGDYDVAASAAGFTGNTRPVTVRRGETATVAIALAAVVTSAPAPPKPAVVAGGIKDLTGAWEPGEDGWSNFGQQDGYSLLQLNPEGTAIFEMQRKKPGAKIARLFGKEKASWVAFYVDPKNHLLFELEADKLTVFEILKGSKKQKERISVDKDADEVKVQLLPERVVVDIGKGHLSAAPDKSLQGGKFGFKGPAGLRDFRFQGVAAAKAPAPRTPLIHSKNRANQPESSQSKV